MCWNRYAIESRISGEECARRMIPSRLGQGQDFCPQSPFGGIALVCSNLEAAAMLDSILCPFRLLISTVMRWYGRNLVQKYSKDSLQEQKQEQNKNRTKTEE